MPRGFSIVNFLKVTLVALVALALAPPLSAAEDYTDPIVVKDPHFGEVLFYFYQDDYFQAIVRLLAAKEQAQLRDHAEEAELLLGGMYLSYGHHLEAASIFERLLADNVSPDTRDRTWFFLAKIWYQRGYLDRSQQALDNTGDHLPINLKREALLLEAQILIDESEYDRAIALLRNWDGETEWASYAKFNIGVALVRSGRVDEAKKLLDELGLSNPANEELASLRDRANLALGYALLQDSQPTAAKIPLQRIRLQGPFSNKALLGVGWADAELDDYEGALAPWMELGSRDLLDTAVQESMLAIPYALAKLDSISQAADHYLNAIEAYYEETRRLDRTIERVESGEMIEQFLASNVDSSSGWYWRAQQLPDGPEAGYLFEVLATHQFQEGLKNYRDLAYMHGNLDQWQNNVAVYGNMLETRMEAFIDRFARVEDALGRADLDGLVRRKLEIESTLNNIDQSNDWLALASRSDFEMWGQITSLEKTPALQADLIEADEALDKIKLLKGVLQWRLERDFKLRMWQMRRDLMDTGKALVDTQRAARQVDESIRSEPLRYANFSDRVYGLSPRIDGMKGRVQEALDKQRLFLQSIAVRELKAQKQRLDVYAIQAQFALAAIYDISATSGE